MWAQEKRLEGCGAERTPEMHSLRMQGPGYGRDATTPKGRPSLPEEGRHPSQQPLAGDGFGRAASGRRAVLRIPDRRWKSWPPPAHGAAVRQPNDWREKVEGPGLGPGLPGRASVGVL